MGDEISVDTSGTNAHDILVVVNTAINAAVEGIKSGDIKGVKIPDLLKLIALKKELEEEQPKDINVRWIETWESTPSNEE